MVVFGVFGDGVGRDAAGFPEGEIRRVVLLASLGGVALGFEVVELLVRECAVVVEAGHVEVHRAVGLVGVAGLDQRLDEVDDFGNVL